MSIKSSIINDDFGGLTYHQVDISYIADNYCTQVLVYQYPDLVECQSTSVMNLSCDDADGRCGANDTTHTTRTRTRVGVALKTWIWMEYT